MIRLAAIKLGGQLNQDLTSQEMETKQTGGVVDCGFINTLPMHTQTLMLRKISNQEGFDVAVQS